MYGTHLTCVSVCVCVCGCVCVCVCDVIGLPCYPYLVIVSAATLFNNGWPSLPYMDAKAFSTAMTIDFKGHVGLLVV